VLRGSRARTGPVSIPSPELTHEEYGVDTPDFIDMLRDRDKVCTWLQ
jgi:hypothetical protein